MDEFGKVYMSTVGCGIVYGQLSSGEGPTKPTDTDIVYGDANVDDKVDLSDAVLILQYLSNPDKYGPNVHERGNGVTTQDALSIQKYIVELVTELPESYKK